MIKLSTVIITLNEASNIKRCLESVIPVSDEVIVVDSESTDSTIEIAANLGAKTLIQPFLGHKQQKAFAAQQASFDYILSIDADEALDSELQNAIRQLKTNWSHDVYTVKRLNQYCGKWIKYSGWNKDINTRVWKKGKANWGGTNPHDKLIPIPDATRGNLKGNLLHFTYNSLSQHLQQIDYFTEIAANQMFEKQKKVSVLTALCKSVFRFFRTFILQRGFLDGHRGLTLCYAQAFETYMKYAKLKLLHEKNNRNE